MSETSDTSTPDSPKSETTETKRRWYQYSLKFLLIVMFLFCFLFAWGGYKIRQAEKQKVAVEWVKEHGGIVRYDYQLDEDGKKIKNAEPPGPDWLRNLVGIDYFCNVEMVAFRRLWLVEQDGTLTVTDVTELTPLQSLPLLKKVVFVEVLPSNEELQRFQAELPNCKMFRGFFWSQYWCKQCNEWHEVDYNPFTKKSDPHSSKP